MDCVAHLSNVGGGEGGVIAPAARCFFEVDMELPRNDGTVQWERQPCQGETLLLVIFEERREARLGQKYMVDSEPV